MMRMLVRSAAVCCYSCAGFNYHIMFSIVCINNHEKIDSTIRLKNNQGESMNYLLCFIYCGDGSSNPLPRLWDCDVGSVELGVDPLLHNVTVSS